MFGNATVRIPGSGVIEPSQTDGLSNYLAMVMGRLAARTLSEDDGPVTVTLENGMVLKLHQNHMWLSETSDKTPPIDIIRLCGGFREYANDVIGGPIL